MSTTPIIFHFSAALLLTVIPILGSVSMILVRENSPPMYSLSNMLSAGLYFALGITGHHDYEQPSGLFFFAKNLVIAFTFSIMIMMNIFANRKEMSSVRYARVNSNEVGIEMPSGSSSPVRNPFDFALDTPSGISPHFPIIVVVFSYFSFIEAMQFSQVDHTGYGSLSEILMNKVMMSVCFGTAAAGDSILSKTLPKLSPIYFVSSPLGIVMGLLVHSELPVFMTRYTYFTINGVCLYVATCQLLPEELKNKDATGLKMGFFLFGVLSVFVTEYFMY